MLKMLITRNPSIAYVKSLRPLMGNIIGGKIYVFDVTEPILSLVLRWVRLHSKVMGTHGTHLRVQHFAP